VAAPSEKIRSLPGIGPRGAASLLLSFGSVEAALVLAVAVMALEWGLNQLAIASLRSIVDGEGRK
jgi:hypothetical protein